MSVDNKMPEIRFKGFSDAWKSFPLEEISDVLDGDRGLNYPNGEELKAQGHTLFLSASNVTKSGFRFDTRQYITKDKSESLGSGKLIINDIILTSRGSIGHIAWYNKNISKAIPFARINSGMLILRVKDNIVPSIISQYLKSPEGKKKIETISFGSAQPQLTKASILKFIVTIPFEKKEQITIGNYFQKLDELINKHQQKHDKLSNIKKAMLEKMFPKQGETIPEIRFKGFSGNWIKNSLGDLIDIRSAARVHKDQWTESGVPFFRTSDVVSIYKGQENTKIFISHDIYYKLSEKIGKVTNDDLLITGGGSIGIPYLVQNNNPLYFKDADLLWLKNNNKFNGYFLYTFFFSATFKKYINSISHTGTIAHYTIEQAKATPINTCSHEEQTQIANYFQKLDILINQHQQQITKLNNIKQACLRKMFV
ncbi:restriction endonuclease subunit S [Pantoea sp. GbtcB22]|uniref:restriction endonuclease subunit S n=1 Tax=Pantoea sp. GbtcB22 TaxID=2824767 RepID=UPI001C2F35AA|nr:restriction endonuclease subunit S [Pantoea sp. GbtcB22]